MTLSSEAEQNLIHSASAARDNAYAPYSKFHVGAAILTDNGDVFVGCNVENASYGMTICAERVAATSAVAAGQQQFVAVALSLPGGQTPCGACRQFLAEFQPDLPVLIHDADSGRVSKTTLTKLLPAQFEFDGPTD
ncbi:UNVERIFIED_CONTAM: hypothetical protein GTU68_032318 [Idotea baltica]|nr:hypothetical protein [Idotea baltica]